MANEKTEEEKFDQELKDYLWEGAVCFEKIAQDALRFGQHNIFDFFSELTEDFLHDLEHNMSFLQHVRDTLVRLQRVIGRMTLTRKHNKKQHNVSTVFIKR